MSDTDAPVTWTLVPHVCSECLGRLVQSGRRFMCADCERETAGKPDGICGCGLSGKRRGIDGKPLLRCTENPDRTKLPARYIILYGAGAAGATVGVE